MDKTREKEIPPQYQQPVRGYIGRFINDNDTLEEVDYVPQSHLRIWYNNQTEEYAPHHHDAMEIIVCMKDHYTVVVQSKTYVLHVGDILFIPRRVLHEIKTAPSGNRFIFLVNVDMFQCFQDMNTLEPLFIEPCLCTAATYPKSYQKIYSYFMQMIDIYFSNEMFWEGTIYTLIIKSMIMIGKEHFAQSMDADSGMTKGKHREHYEKFANLINYINANYTEDLTLEQMAAYIGFSKYHFSRLFKQHTNTTFYDYLCRKRVQAAQALLTTDLSITEIAFQTGFNNLTTFCRCFKKYADCSPTRYREMFREEAVSKMEITSHIS